MTIRTEAHFADVLDRARRRRRAQTLAKIRGRRPAVRWTKPKVLEFPEPQAKTVADRDMWATRAMAAEHELAVRKFAAATAKPARKPDLLAIARVIAWAEDESEWERLSTGWKKGYLAIADAVVAHLEGGAG